MKQFNKWRLFAGLIVFFAGLDVTLLLSHMSRLYGVIFLIIGSFLITTSNPEWMESMRDKLPESVISLGEKRNLKRIHAILLVSILIVSSALFYTQLQALLIVISLVLISEIIAWRKDGYKKRDHILLATQFQIFVFLSTTIYLHFGTLFGYRDIPEIFAQFFIISAWLLQSIYLKTQLLSKEDTVKKESVVMEGTPLSESLINLLTFKGLLKPYMPLAGIVAIIFVVVFNMMVHGYLRLGSHDGITLLFALCLIVYNKIPEKYSFERDFAMLFLMFLFIILVLPITVIHYMHGPLTEDTNSPVVYHLLARPTSWLLNLLGMESIAMLTSTKVIIGLWVPHHIHNMIYTQVSIGLSCTGLYSVTTFISAFLAFLMVHFSKFTFKLGLFMVFGIFTSWVANIFRMTLILIVRYHYGTEAMLWTHHNAGIFIFMAWVALFWGLMFKYFDIPVHK